MTDNLLSAAIQRIKETGCPLPNTLTSDTYKCKYSRNPVAAAWGGLCPAHQAMEAMEAALKTSDDPGRQQATNAIECVNRRHVWQALDEIKKWSEHLEAELQKDGIIPWLQLAGLSEAAVNLIYSAGHVNAAILAAPGPPEVGPVLTPDDLRGIT